VQANKDLQIHNMRSHTERIERGRRFKVAVCVVLLGQHGEPFLHVRTPAFPVREATRDEGLAERLEAFA
jgi:hypothetical protein